MFEFCGSVIVSGATVPEVNGVYYPNNTCGEGSGYGKEVIGTRFPAFLNGLTGALIVFRWEDDDFRGWVFEVKGKILYYDKLNRQWPRQLIVNGWDYNTDHPLARPAPSI